MVFRILEKLRSVSDFSKVLIFTFIGFIPDIFNGLSELVFNSSLSFDIPELQEMPLLKVFIYSVVIAPIFETLVFQTLIISCVSLIPKINAHLIAFLSASFFAMVHSYSYHYLFFAFFGGLVLAYFYLLILKQSNHKKATIYTCILHATRNLVIFILDDIFKLF